MKCAMIGGSSLESPDAGKPRAYRIDGQVAVCCCVPLRTAVALTGLLCALAAAVELADHVLVEAWLRPFTGGYVARSRFVVSLLEALGVFMGPIGIAGAYQLNTHYIQLFLGYQAARLLGWVWMFYNDVPALWACERWLQDPKRAAAAQGWNGVLFSIAVDNRCPQERTTFCVCSLLAVAFFAYCTSATQRLLADIEDEPRYLLKLPAGAISGAFYTRSLASRSLPEQIHEGTMAAARQLRQKASAGRAAVLPGVGAGAPSGVGFPVGAPVGVAMPLASASLPCAPCAAASPHFGSSQDDPRATGSWRHEVLGSRAELTAAWKHEAL